MFGYRVEFVIDNVVVDTYTREHEGKEKFLLSRTLKGFLTKDSNVEFRITPYSIEEKEPQSQSEVGNTVIVKGELAIEQIRHFR